MNQLREQEDLLAEQELREQEQATQEKEEPPQNFDIRQLIREVCGIKVYEDQKQNMEDTMLELLEVCRQKELYCMHSDVDNLIEKPEYSLSMWDEHLSTIPKTESDEVIKSSVKNLVQIPSEYEVTFNNESECDVPVKDESSPIFTTFSNPIFDYNDDFTSSDDELLSEEDFDYLEEFSGELMPTNIINEEHIKREHEEYISLMEKLLTINSFPRPLKNFHANMIIETIPSYPIPVEDSNSLREEIDIFTGTDDFMHLGIESDNYDSEGDIHFLEELLSNDSISLPENKSSNFDHHDDPSFPRPPLETPDVKVFFDFEPNSGELISAVMNNIDELNEDECFDPGEGVISIIVGTISTIHEKESEWYVGCKVCKKKVIRSSYMIDFEADVMVNMIGGAQNKMLFQASKQCFVFKYVSAYQLCDKYGKARIFKVTIKMCSPQKLRLCD
nr:hypothetical protein [Tanacetum cinerariifolium]